MSPFTAGHPYTSAFLFRVHIPKTLAIILPIQANPSTPFLLLTHIYFFHGDRGETSACLRSKKEVKKD